jgi:hypothetical protein
MQKQLTTIILLFATAMAFAQRKTDLGTAEPYMLELNKETHGGGGKIPFKEIIVKDYRYDTTKYGYIRVRGVRKMVFDANPSISFSSLLNNYFKANLDSSADKSLVIIIKTFWLQQGTSDLYTDEKLDERWGFLGGEDITGACYTSFDVFALGDNSYRALFRIEDEFEGGRYRSSRVKQLFFAPFDSVVHRLTNLDVEKTLSTKKKFSLPELEKNYQSRFELPILKSEPAGRGVFMTFDDFKYNRLSHPEFVTTRGSLTDQLYIGPKGDKLLSDYWGFYDGKDYYIRINFNFFKMVRQNNTFDLWGAKNIKRTTDALYYDNNRSSLFVQTTKLELRPLQLDMSLGEVY